MIVIPHSHSSSHEPQILTDKQRKVLLALLNRDLHRCTTSALTAAQRLGWTLGPAGRYELTSEGRRLAELCETTPPDKKIPLN